MVIRFDQADVGGRGGCDKAYVGVGAECVAQNATLPWIGYVDEDPNRTRTLGQ